MTRALCALLLASCASAAPPPPTTFSIDAEFSPEQAAVLRDSVSAWCDAVGWCPTETAYSDRGRFILAAEYDRTGPNDTSSAYNDDNNNIYVDAASHVMSDMRALWLTAAHEAGHYGIEGHPVEAPALMAPIVHDSLPRTIDAASRDAWCAEQGC